MLSSLLCISVPIRVCLFSNRRVQTLQTVKRRQDVSHILQAALESEKPDGFDPPENLEKVAILNGSVSRLYFFFRSHLVPLFDFDDIRKSLLQARKDPLYESSSAL